MHDLQSLLAQHGLWLVFGNVLLAQLGVPLPAMPMLIIAGAFVANGDLAFAAVTGVAVVASLLGDVPWYFAGRRYGYRVLNTLCRIAIEPDSCVRQTENIYERWGAPSLVLAKYVPGFATVAPPLAGAMALGFWRFLMFSAIGALLWALAPLLVGMLFSTQVEQALGWFERMGARGFALAAAIIALYVGVKLAQRHLLIRRLRASRVTVAELLGMMSSKAPLVVLDARSRTARKLDPRHIPGALVIDLAAVEAALHKGVHDHDIVVYCS